MLLDGFTRTEIRTSGARIVVAYGGSGPPVLLMHGNPFTHLSWHAVAPRLARNFTVVCPDLRGYGDSEKPPDGDNHANYSFRAMAQDQVEVMAALGFPRFIGRFGLGRTFKVLGQAQKGLSAPTVSLATTRYYSAAPFRFGAYAVRHSLAPRTPADPAARPGSTPDYLAEELIPRLQRGPVQWDFQVQFFADPARTPIEDPSVDWPEELSPHLTVGRLTLPQQDPRSDAGQALAREVESLSFDPWHAQEELRPLGAIMRARNHAYRLSTQARGAAPEPTGS